jgi:ethanolamine utilization protein EutP
MIIGPVGSGKSTLLAALGLGPKEVKKTEALTYNQGLSIDTPGEMMALPRFYNALILNSARVSLVLMLMDGQKPLWLPAKICFAFKTSVVGVVTKIDLAEQAMIRRAELSLRNAGVEDIFRLSNLTGAGLDELKSHLSRRLTLDFDSAN